MKPQTLREAILKGFAETKAGADIFLNIETEVLAFLIEQEQQSIDRLRESTASAVTDRGGPVATKGDVPWERRRVAR